MAVLMPVSAQQQSKKDCTEQSHLNTLPYHGKRLSPDTAEFYIVEVSGKQQKSGWFAITILFNVPINPSTISSNSIQINGKNLPPKSKLTYNKNGTALRIQLAQIDNNEYNLYINSLTSFNGNTIENQAFEKIYDGYNYNIEKE